MIITTKDASCDIALQYKEKAKVAPNVSEDEIKNYVHEKILKHQCHNEIDCDALSGRILASLKSGNGKTQFAKLLHEKVGCYNYRNVPIHERVCNHDTIVDECLKEVCFNLGCNNSNTRTTRTSLLYYNKFRILS